MSVPLPDKNLSVEVQDDDILLAMCVWGESRGEPLEGKIAVAHVVANRRKRGGWYGKNWNQVILKPYQFSCFNRSDPNSVKLLDPLRSGAQGVWETCYAAALAVMHGIAPDPTNGATHYYSGSKPPPWRDAMTPTTEIGRHKFFREGK